MRDNLLEVLELYLEFAESFSNNLEVTFNLRDVSSLSFVICLSLVHVLATLLVAWWPMSPGPHSIALFDNRTDT